MRYRVGRQRSTQAVMPPDFTNEFSRRATKALAMLREKEGWKAERSNWFLLGSALTK